MNAVALSQKSQLETRLGVAIVSRNESLLQSVAAELSACRSTEIKSIWERVEVELDADDVAWLKESLHDSLIEDVELIDPLTDGERKEKEEIETRLNSFFASFVERGKDLSILRDKRLYREDYTSWDAYCRLALSWSKTYVDRLIKASKVVRELTPVGATKFLPGNEYVARELGKIKSSDSRQRVWEEALRISKDKPVTCEIVRRVREEFYPVIDEADIVSDLDFSFRPDETVIVSMKNSPHKGKWGWIDSSFSTNRYKVIVGKETISFNASDLKPVNVNADCVNRIKSLLTHQDSHIVMLAESFLSFPTLMQWQLDLLSYLEDIVDA